MKSAECESALEGKRKVVGDYTANNILPAPQSQTLELRPFQQLGVDFLTSARRAILADEPGLGKTVQALMAIDRLRTYPAVVLCPSSVKMVWQSEIEKWLPGRTALVLNGRKATPLPLADFYILNYEIASAWFRTLQRLSHAVIVDESHRCRNTRTTGYEAAKSLAWAATVRFCLTGTPIVNCPKDLLGQVVLLGRTKELFGSIRQFLDRYTDPKVACVLEDDAGDPYTVMNYTGASNLKELNDRIKPVMLRRTKTGVLPDLPSKQRIEVPCEPPVST